MNLLATTARPGPLPRRRKQHELTVEPFVSGPRKAITSARTVARLLEDEPALWPGLTTFVTDTDGRLIVHYAAGRESREASSLFGPDGVVARWRSVLADPKEARRERNEGRERVVTLRGRHSGYPVTVLFTVIGAA